MIQFSVRRIVNNLIEVKAYYDKFMGSAIDQCEEKATKKAVEWLKREIDLFAQNLIKIEIVPNNVLTIYKMKIRELAELADHYYLSENIGLDNSLGWGAKGLEIRGKIRITLEQKKRIQLFSQLTRYDIAFNNCEHFANYVMHGLNMSSQQEVWYKNLGSKAIRYLQTTQTVQENFNQEIAQVLNYNLMSIKVDKFYQDYKLFCQK